LHRQLCRAFLPEAIVQRPKRGFASNVVDDWFRGVFDSKMVDTLLDDSSRIYQYLRPQAVRQLYEQHVAERHDNHKVLFSLVVFEEWLRSCEEPVSVS
jgi:asparagine synthase (glutamine-hydrolysing)